MQLCKLSIFLLFLSSCVTQDGNDNVYNPQKVENNLNSENNNQQSHEKGGHMVKRDLIKKFPQDRIDNAYHHETVENNVPKATLESDFDNGGYLVEQDSTKKIAQGGIANVYDREIVDNGLTQKQKKFTKKLTEEELNDKLIADSDSLETEDWMEQDFIEEIDNSEILVGKGKIRQNPIKYELNKVEHDVETNSIDLLSQRDLEQRYNQNENARNHIEIQLRNETEADATNTLVKDEIEKHSRGFFDNLVPTPVSNEESQTEDEHADKNSIGTDSIEILGLPEAILSTDLLATVRYIITGPRILVIDIFTVSADERKSIYHTEWIELIRYPVVTRTKVVKVTLPDNLVYKEDKIQKILPDLHSESLLVRACVVDYQNPSIILLHTEHSLPLTPPWSRLPKYTIEQSCSSWIAMLFKNLSKNEIPKCPKLDHAVQLLSFPVVLVSNEFGYKKFLQNLHQAEEFPERSPQFSLATWLYLTDHCSKDMCPLLYHMKGSDFKTPLIGLLGTGHLHLQFHYEDGSGYAFLVDAQIPIHEWVHLTITFKQTVVSVYVRHGNNLEFVKSFVHSDFPAGLYHYNDTDGYWGLGGSPGFVSPRGFIGPARIFRRTVLSKKAIDVIFSAKSKPDLGIANHFKICEDLKINVKYLLKKESKSRMHCSPKSWLKRSQLVFCDASTSGLAAETVNILMDTLKIEETISSDMMQSTVYNHAFDLIKTDESGVQDALLLLSFSSCLGHPPSLYLISVLSRVGLGVAVDLRMSQRTLLLGAFHNHPLSQMSLAYKHYVGVDGLPQDHEVAGTYYRYAAVQSKDILVEHNEVDTHSEAVRLDKREDIENYRGPNSNWFSWLKHQARRGFTDVQGALGEMFYYGSREFRRNLTKAVEFYEMGANRGDPQMLFNLGVVKLRGHGVSANVEEASNLLKASAELGFAPAYNALGYYELNVRQNKSGAVEYFRTAAEHQNRDGLYNFGFALENGLAPGTVGDLRAAMPYYVSAANKGHAGACVIAGDAFSAGQFVERNIKLSIILHKFVADQIPEIGLHLRHGLDEYFAESWYQSLLYYLLAAEAGMEVAQYNVALLCEWNWGEISRHTGVDCAWRYYNHSAKLEWVPSLLKTGDNYWYGITVEQNIASAVQLYSQAANKEQNPQAIYNLGYLVENNYPLDGLTWSYYHHSKINRGNLSFAAVFYRKCRDSSDEAFIPCSLGLVRVLVKMTWQQQLATILLILLSLLLFASFALIYYSC